jgi:hypothetical protein
MSTLIVKDIVKANRLIAVLGVLLLSSIILFLLIGGVFSRIPPFHDPVPNADANDQIDAYRESITLRQKTKVIWYDADDVTSYLNNTYADWTKNFSAPTGYDWGIGFYTIRREVDGESRLDFMIIPTLKKTDGPEILDFRDEEVFNRYYRRDVPIAGLCADCTGYDKGHIWP